MTTLIEKLAQSVPGWGAKLAYGDTTTVNGQDVVPVAFVIFGFGGGEGSGEMPESQGGPAGKGEGSGGGGGGYALPIGAYIGGPDGVHFHPNPVGVAVIAVPLVAAIGWALSRIIRASS